MYNVLQFYVQQKRVYLVLCYTEAIFSNAKILQPIKLVCVNCKVVFKMKIKGLNRYQTLLFSLLMSIYS